MNSSLICIHDSQISLSFWQGWLYKRFFLRPALTLGIAELRVGRTAMRKHMTDVVSYYVLDGFGQVEIGGHLQGFEAGHVFTIQPQQSYEFDPAEPTRLLCASAAPDAPPNMLPRLLLGDNRDLFQRNGTPPKNSQCHFVANGKCHLSIQGETCELKAGTAFYIHPQVEYTLENHGSTSIRLVNVYAGIAARDEKHSIKTT